MDSIRASATAVLGVTLAAMAGCSDPSPSAVAKAKPAPSAAAPAPPPPATPVNATATVAPASAPPSGMQAVNSASFSEPGEAKGPKGTGEASSSTAAQPALVRAEVLLDRANFSPGVIDGRMGENVGNALRAYQKQKGLPTSGRLDAQTWQALTGSDTAPALKSYSLSQDDVAGPWTPDVGEDLVKMSKLAQTGYTNVVEMLAERFHMDESLLRSLNPGVEFTKAGATLAVVDPGSSSLPAVASIQVDKATKSVSAYDADQKLLAVFPATVGSTERPSPKGVWKVKGVAQNPDYTYDPSKLTWGPKSAGKLHVPPGPNGPVGVVWIALSAPDYGIHGTPDPRVIGKTASHGCVRLTNWDAEELSRAVKPGVKVSFAS